MAEAFGAEQSIEFDADDLADLMLEDTDFLLLFDLSLDGIEYQTDTTLKHLGIPSLRPENCLILLMIAVCGGRKTTRPVYVL